MAARGPSAGGFTLLEVLVALVLVTTAVMAAVALSKDNLDQAAMIRMQDRAVLLARAKMFELAEDGLSSTLGREGDFAPEHAGFRWSASASATNESGLYQAVLTVSWGDPKSGEVRLVRLFRD